MHRSPSSRVHRAVPLALLPTFFSDRSALRVAGLCMFMLGAYCIAVTFSRALYTGLTLVTLLIVSLGALNQLRAGKISLARSLLVLCLMLALIVLCFVAHHFGGVQGVAGLTATVLGLLAARALLANEHWLWSTVGQTSVALFGLYVMGLGNRFPA